MLAITAMSTPSLVLRYAAAFFFVLVAIASAYALFKLGALIGRADKTLGDVSGEAVPLMRKAGETLDGVNANLSNVDVITKDVADMTDRLDAMAGAVEGAVTTPARKAAAFSAGVQSAVSSFMKRDKAPSGTAGEAAPSGGAAPAGDDAPADDDTSGPGAGAWAAADAGAGWADVPGAAADEAAADATAAAGEAAASAEEASGDGATGKPAEEGEA
jgi:hypothetical protein